MRDKKFLADEIERVKLDLARAKPLEYAEKLRAYIAEMEAEIVAQTKVLACHSKGDKRFSALYAKVSVFGRTASIEQHYQLAKRFCQEEAPAKWQDAKGRRPDSIVVGGKILPPEFAPQFYALLWCKYLDAHPELVEIASDYDEFEDIFSRPGHVSQADCIKIYCKQGRVCLLKSCQEFLGAWKGE